MDNLKINNVKTKLLKCFLRNKEFLHILSSIEVSYLGEEAVDVTQLGINLDIGLTWEIKNVGSKFAPSIFGLRKPSSSSVPIKSSYSVL